MSGNTAERLSGKRVCICVGAGGVGKTTTSAALALGLAARGRKVAVVTIDPAPRLAGALGLARLAAVPRRVDTAPLASRRSEVKGELWAMRLDSKRTFDDMIARLAPDAGAREEILSNPIYRQLSSAVAGSHELSAVAKLYELCHEHDFETIVLDTPPSRNAIDFLEAPTRMLGFLEGRALRVFTTPGGMAARMFGRSTGIAFAIFARVTGVDLFADLSTFFRSMAGVVDGFGERTREVAALLRAPSTTFAIVTSPELEPAHEAGFLAATLAQRDMSRGLVIVNRVHTHGLGGSSREQVQELLRPRLGERLAARVSANLAEFEVLVQRDANTVAQLSFELGERAPVLVPQLDYEVSDLAGLASVAEHLFGDDALPADGTAHRRPRSRPAGRRT